MVEFRSASSEGRWRKKRKKGDRIAVKPKSADEYVGRLNQRYNYNYNSSSNCASV